MGPEAQGLVQTISILSACLVYLAKLSVDTYKRRKNGYLPQDCRSDVCHKKVEDLHRWHAPVQDQKTGQPKFMWYENNEKLHEELSSSRKATEALGEAMASARESIEGAKDSIERLVLVLDEKNGG